jgi:hypothetical protein
VGVVITDAGEYLVGHMEGELKPQRFVPIHRASLEHFRKVGAMPLPSDEGLNVRLRGGMGTQLKMVRHRGLSERLGR